MEICFTTPKKWNPLSSLIKLFDDKEYSHVVLKWHSKSLDRDMVYQSNLHGMLFIGGKFFVEKNIIVKTYNLKLEDYQENQIKQWCVDASGGTYDVGALFKSLFNKFLNVFNLKAFTFKSNGTSRTICSELVGRVLYPYFNQHINPAGLDLLTPSDLERILDSLCKKYPTIIEVAK